MKIATFFICFILSAGLAVFGVMIAYRLKIRKDSSYTSSLFYYTLLVIVYGFYSIWGYLAFGHLLHDVIASPNNLRNIVSIFPLMGIPVLIVAWYLFIQFCVEFAGHKLPTYIGIIYFSVCLLILLLLANYFRNQLVNQEAIKHFLIFKSLAVAHLLAILTGSSILVIFRPQKSLKMSKDLLGVFWIIPATFVTISLFMVSSHWFAAALFVLFYFSQQVLAPGYIYFKVDQVSEMTDKSFESFCRSFEISKRETEVILEICKGKTNQAIADSLFITLQTVKDHIHHIYTKTGVKNRVQLINMVREKIKSEPANNKP
ncbi:MAG TPA: helix-turn-helix transcriptional regulator [Sunxiuqinia sp.]|nr:helix-turn-helix transcriptional regulator [Sunxiuqinia sp.]